MKKTSNKGGISLTRRTFTAGAAAAAASLALPMRHIHAATALKVGVLLPRSGPQAGIGQDCQRGVDVAGPILKELGYPDLEIVSGDTETNVQIARAQAEKMINDGVQLLVGAFDSGQTTAIAQVAEQKGIPLVINIAASPAITEQGYKFVFRNFPNAPKILGDAFNNQKEIFETTGATPKTAVLLHVNDTFGKAMQGGIGALMPKFGVPYELVEQIAYDPKARDLSVEISKAKATNADALLVVSRLNDAILLTRELVKQRWNPMGVLSMGPGWYEDQYIKTLGKLADDPISFVPWQDYNKPLTKVVQEALAKAHPDRAMNTNHTYTFEALMIAADAFKRAGSADPNALADALRATNITDNISAGPGIQFNEKGQNDKLLNVAVQNRDGKHVVVSPKSASNADPIWPMRPYDQRG